MKKSEMIQKMVDWGNSQNVSDDISAEQMVELMLDKVIELGMQPPPLPGSATAKIQNRCQWEPET